MRPIAIFLALAGVGIITWLIVARPKAEKEEPKQQPITVSKHTDAFNAGIKNLLDEYYKLSEKFVNWDSTGTQAQATSLIKTLDNTSLDELKKDSSAIYETAIGFIDYLKGDANTIITEKGIRQQREAFSNMADNLAQLLITVKYDREKLYKQECSMAYGGSGTGYWISKSDKDDDRRNPFLGLHDPDYGKGMLTCGTIKQTINMTGVQ